MKSHLKLLLTTALAIHVIVWQQSHSITENVMAQPKTIAAGTAPVIKALTLEDKEVLINYSSVKTPTVLYVFVPSCPWCARNWDNVRSLAKSASKTHRFLGLALSDYQLQDQVKNNQVNFPVYKQLSPETMKKLALGPVPQTIVISHQGKILKNWVGAYSGAIQREVEAFFRAKLPGVAGQSSSEPQFCPYCIWEGRINSPGKLLKVDGKQIRCKQSGKWTDPY
ncbi:MAG: hypothetical protein ABI977_23475 [Acidobacteriota bacterium]